MTDAELGDTPKRQRHSRDPMAGISPAPTLAASNGRPGLFNQATANEVAAQGSSAISLKL
jgi:hypothetical protein